MRGDGDGPLDLTEEGLRALGPFEPLPGDPDGLFDEWKRHPELGRAHHEIMRVLKENGGSMSKEDIAALTTSDKGTPYEPDGGGFTNALSKLRTLGVIEGKKDIQLAEGLLG